MSYRSRKEEEVYNNHLKSTYSDDSCNFCQIIDEDPQFVKQTSSFKVIRNIFPYSYFDNHKVDDHLMVIPKKHTDTLISLTPQESSEYIKLISSYESIGYDIFARAPSSKQKTVQHQHTHLIKPADKEVYTFIYIRKPFVRIAR